MAYSAWSVSFGEQPSAAKWNILGTNDASFNDGTGIGTGVISTTHLATSAVTSPKIKRTRYTATPSGSGITTETVIATITVDSQTTNTLVKLTSAFVVSTGTGAPQWNYSSRIRLTNTSGTVLQRLGGLKSAATGVQDFSRHSHCITYALPSSTSQVFVLTLQGDQAISVDGVLSSGQLFMAELESNV